MTSNLKHEADIYLWLKERILEEHACLHDDDVALADTLEGITHLHEAVEWVMQSIAEDESMLKGIADRAAQLKKREERIEYRAAQKRKLILDTLIRLDLKRIDHPEFTIYRQKTPAKVDVFDETKVPEKFKVEQPKTLDKKAIKEALKDGIEVPGAEMTLPGETLVIRRS